MIAFVILNQSKCVGDVHIFEHGLLILVVGPGRCVVGGVEGVQCGVAARRGVMGGSEGGGEGGVSTRRPGREHETTTLTGRT